jgi:hypothetical protein
MRLAVHMENLAKAGCLHATLAEMQFLIQKPSANVREEKIPGVDFSQTTILLAATDGDLSMLHQIYTAGFHPG